MTMCQLRQEKPRISLIDQFGSDLQLVMFKRCLSRQKLFIITGNHQHCSEIKKELGLNRQKPVPGRFVSRQDIFKRIWSDQSMDEQDWQHICQKYPALLDLNDIIHKFRRVLHDRDVDQLTLWMEQYCNSRFAHINSFIHGLKRDWKAVQNGFTYAYNSGFVEGTVNKLKTEKRMMYGRASSVDEMASDALADILKPKRVGGMG